jgi:[ribosomal protein S5]-alanine N-acetyltransferase
MQFIEIETERLILSLLEPDKADMVCKFLHTNWEHLRPWSPAPAEDYFDQTYWQEKLAQDRQDYIEGKSLCLFIAPRQREWSILGWCNFTQIVRGPFQACYLGYCLGKSAVGQGIMYEALQSAIACVFDHLELHRIMANYMPINARSGKLLQRLGFRVEGYAYDYLSINGAWRDHILTSLTNPKALTK